MANLPIDYLAEARVELLDALHWYRDRSPGAAESFVRAVERAEQAIQSDPETWSQHTYGTRRYSLHRFPYVLVYRVLLTRIEILAVAHGRRKPGYWRDRL